MSRKYTRRNPGDPHRRSSWTGTEKCIERYQGKSAVLLTWEKMASDSLQNENHDYLVELRARVRTARNLIMHRADARAEI